MTPEEIHGFFRRAEEDASLRDELAEALGREEAAVTAFLAVARGHGFAFTAEEFERALATWRAWWPAEMNDEERQKVTGGVASSSTNQVDSLLTQAAGRIGMLHSGPTASEIYGPV